MRVPLVIILSVVALGLAASAMAYRASSRHADLQARALEEATFQNAELGKIETEARQLLGAAAIAAARPDACDSDFREIGRSNGFFVGLAAFDMDGARTCMVSGGWPALLGPRLLELSVARNGFAVGESTIAAVGLGKTIRVLPFAQPVHDQGGRVTGVVVVMVELDRLARRLARNWRTEESIITVADRAGNILVRLPNSASWAGRRLPDELTSVLHDPKPGTVKVPLDVGDRVEAIGYVSLEIAPRDLFVSVSFQTNSVVGELKRSLRRSVMPLTLVLLAAGLLFVLLPQRGHD